MSTPARNSALLLSAILLVACGGTPVPELTPVGTVIPDDVSFEGRWQLRGVDTGPGERARQSDAEGSVVPDRRSRGRRSKQSKDGPSVHVFLETGSDLKITQTADGLFISFDRSVVEEYRFREHRRINVGPIEADRASGWENGRYVIKTLDHQGAELTETYALQDNGRQLLRTISIVYDEEETLALQQVFDRRD
jgi:hypothetical protein